MLMPQSPNEGRILNPPEAPTHGLPGQGFSAKRKADKSVEFWKNH
jgi:hypothetical protein